MKTYPLKSIIVGCALLATITPTAGQQTSGVLSGTKSMPISEPAFIARGKSVEAAAKAVRALCQCLMDKAIRHVVERSLGENSHAIVELIQNTGQKGVLVEVKVESVGNDPPHYYVIGGNVNVVGAGSSAFEVALGNRQDKQLSIPLKVGGVLDHGKSEYLWFTKDGKGFKAQVDSFEAISRRVALVYADEKLLESTNEAATADALKDAALHLEKTLKDEKLKHRLAELNRRRAADDKQIERIEADLARELERARRAQKTAATLSLISAGMTLGSQIATVRASLGDSTPDSIQSVNSPQDLEAIVKSLATEAEATQSKLALQYSSLLDSRSGMRAETLSLIRLSKYPTHNVPQMKP